uniref:Ovule protein n=1 Tax=Brugia timori TaxID=42155 RepID=A0A0R3QGR1_9BILA
LSTTTSSSFFSSSSIIFITNPKYLIVLSTNDDRFVLSCPVPVPVLSFVSW